MNIKQINCQILEKQSFLCIGLDTDLEKIPPHLLTAEDPVYEFNKQIVDATSQYAIAYKPNTAFYESQGIRGWSSLVKTAAYIRAKDPNLFLIADAKRGDIGNTSRMYAKAFFDPASSGMDFDAVTVSPYMGHDSVSPFLDFEGKWVVILALTSNKGSENFQTFFDQSYRRLFEQVLSQAKYWGNNNQIMFVVGATKAPMLRDIRKIVPRHFLLVPGVGAQGGSLEMVARYGMNKECGLIVNSSRDILFADSSENFAAAAAAKASEIQKEMSQLLKMYLKRKRYWGNA